MSNSRFHNFTCFSTELTKYILVAALLLGNFAAFPPTCGAQEPAARMEQLIRSYVDGKRFMGTVLVAQDTQVLLSKGYGSANLEWNIPDAPSTKFRLGSVTKQFTAACILLLEERGKLRTEDLVKKYMPDAPAAWDKITIFHVLTHTSGIPNFTNFPDYGETKTMPVTPEKLVARFRDKPLDFQPGEKWSYSNSGYVLLGYLVEKISGQSYQDFLQQNIFTPLNMKDSGYDSNSAIIEHRASGYTPGPKGPVNASYLDMTIPFSAGALYSTTEDLLRWEQGLFSGKVVSAASLKKMTTPFKNDYALGLAVRTANGRTLVAHDGGIDGFNTNLSYYPDEKLTIVVLSNLAGATPGELATKLAAVVHGEKVILPSERKEITLPKEVLQRYVGTYELSPDLSIAISLEEGQLMAQPSNGPKVPLFAESGTSFFLKVIDAQIDFSKDEKGEYGRMVLHQGGHDTKGVRK
jgi:CubicO group peptidase (beta-lactamase class C family)